MGSSLPDSKTCANSIQHQVDGFKDQNVLQKHVNFFDRDKDGVVYPWETFQGFREIGCGVLLSSLASVFINVGLSAKTRPGKFPSLLFPIEVKNIQKAKHGSDSGVYDTEGRFVPAKFEEIFGKHARTNANALTSDELMTMLKSNRVPKDYAGWIASYSEWKILYMLCKDKNGLLHKDTIQAVYDGTLFEHMAMEKALAGKKA
ncbi:probable peroxygenase 4 [Rhododendron vialii]|uniref:probable peroxygenase 4 n=1 Tax=Rhododendron vialii TaxID=182163 RepID=UPI00265E7B01|nr:probable peroxygenase 4 [Rhododendron vialii]